MAVCRFSLEGLEPRQLLSDLPVDVLNATGIVAQPAATPAENAAQAQPSLPRASSRPSPPVVISSNSRLIPWSSRLTRRFIFFGKWGRKVGPRQRRPDDHAAL